MKKDPYIKEKLKAATEQFPNENLDDYFEPGVDDKYVKDPAKFMKELRNLAVKNKLFIKDKRSSLEILREMRYGGKW